MLSMVIIDAMLCYAFIAITFYFGNNSQVFLVQLLPTLLL